MANTYTPKRNFELPGKGDLDWDDEINGDLTKIDDGAHFKFLQYPIVTETSAVASGALNVGSIYYYKITAYNVRGESIGSEEVSQEIESLG